MKSQQIRFQKMNTDVADRFLPEGNYKYAKNCRPNNLNSGSGGVVENIKSTLAISRPSEADGQTLSYKGGCLYAKQNSIIGFFKGSSSNFILSYNTKTKTNVVVLWIANQRIDFTNRVTHCGVLDDSLFWVDSNNKLRKLDLVDAMANPTLNYYAASELLIDKFPPLLAPTAAATIDSAVEVNNIDNLTFQFAYAWQYENKEISSWSPFSKSVLPASTNDEDSIFPNNAIDVTVSTGTRQVEKIHIAYRKGTNGTWNTTEILDKANLIILDDTSYTHRFYNNKLIATVVDAEILTSSNNPFYEVGSMTISRDNFLIVGLLKDGLEKPTDIVLTLGYEVQASGARHSNYKFGSVHEFGVIFRDENGRTDGVNAITEISIPFVTDVAVRSTIQGYLDLGSFAYTDITFSVSGTTPSWAKSMSIVYLGNKTLYSFVDYTLSKIEDVGIYTYLDIKGLNKLKDDTSVFDPSRPSSNLSAYTFTDGDRIRFITDENGTLLDSNAYDLDFELLGYVKEVTDTSGNVYYPDTLYINKVTYWASLNIGKKSMFEIYSPKREFADSVYYEIGEVFEAYPLETITTSGTLTTGDSYVFERDMPLYDVAELISDPDKIYDYPNDFDTKNGRVGFTPVLNVLKPAEDVTSSNYSINGIGGTFYHNTSDVAKTVVVTGDYDFTSESNDGYWFVIRKRTVSAVIQDIVLFEEANHTDSEGSLARIVHHQGLINSTITVLPTQYLALYFDNRDNRASHLLLRTPPKIRLTVKIYETGDPSVLSYVESKDYSDYFASDEHGFGRTYIEIPYENTAFRNSIAYSGKYFADTDINDINRIDPINIKSVPWEFGLITALRVKGDVLKVLTPLKEISFYLGKEAYSTSGGKDTNFLLTNNPIGTINVYDSNYGTENPESILLNATNMYYYDRKNAAIVRTSNNGQLDICDYGVKTYLRDVTARINAATTYNSFIGYNDQNNEILVCFVVDGVPETLVFNERSNEWTHYLEYADASSNPPQGLINYGEIMLAYLNGDAWWNEAGTTYNVFFGSNKSSLIRFSVNQEPVSTKIFQQLSYQSTKKFSFIVTTEETEEYSFGMKTIISTGRQVNEEGIQKSDIGLNLMGKSGVESALGYANGDNLRGRYAVVEMTNSDTTRVKLDALNVKYIPSATE